MSERMNAEAGLRGKPLLEAHDVSKSYADGPRVSHALRGVSVSVRKGEISAVVGESGSGKSTLGRILLGLEKPDGGAVRYEGRDLAGMGADERRMFRRSIQVVLQDPGSSLNPRMRIDAILAEPMAAVGAFPRAQFATRIGEILDEVGLPADARFRYPHQFSGGQRQRIAIARAMIVRPSVVVMDEPVSSLDVSVAAQILELIQRLRDAHGMAILLVSHNLGHVWRIAEDVSVMKSGEVVEHGSVKSVFSAPSHPYTRQLLDAVPRISFKDDPDSAPAGNETARHS